MWLAFVPQSYLRKKTDALVSEHADALRELQDELKEATEALASALDKCQALEGKVTTHVHSFFAF